MAIAEAKKTAIDGNELRNKTIRLVRWKGGQHPTYAAITRQMAQEGLRPYAWQDGPNCRSAAQSNGYNKIIYCVEGSLELIFPDLNQTVQLRPGDRIELPRGTRHMTIIGPRGARCVESAL